MQNTRIKARRLPRDPGPAAWNRILPVRAGYAPLEQDVSVDWAIVGGGFAGLAAAQRLSQLVNGESIMVLEASQLAEGPAGRNSGFMIDLPHELNSESYAGSHDADIRQIRQNRSAIRFASAMAEEYGFAAGTLTAVGKVTAACTAKGQRHIQSYRQHLDSIGEPYRLMDHADMIEYTGSEFYHTGLFTPGVVMIQPAGFIRQAAAGLVERKGVVIHENTPVQQLDLTSGLHTLTTPKGKVKARRVIMAVNGHIQSFGFYPSRLLHVFTYASMTRRLSQDELQRLGGEQDWGILPADPMGTTVRKISNYQGSGDRLIIRNHATLNQSLEASQGNLNRARKMQQLSFERRFPMLKGVEMEYLWGGRLCLSLNSVPAFGEVGERLWSACCQNGLGTVKGTLAGMMAAELAAGNANNPELLEFMQTAEPRRLPPEPFLSFGANTVMRIKEWQAGLEV
ncbi:NAD(P)/FAD-dependent oxidoreductase [Oceanobacter mangrovi]|uniref:NAD(P)/FAD-dependent oxidoreductase n=1 Tax=Oceanobacter mangrovi TaxID=2862510 RepID=UPI001C8EAF0A|nr:FAD-binding oxidoreductase [Oceanobacter mangrovi]